MTTPIAEYEVHPFYPTRFLRWAIKWQTIGFADGVQSHSQYRVLQQKWRNISGSEEWRDIPEVLIEPNVTVEEIPDDVADANDVEGVNKFN